MTYKQHWASQIEFFLELRYRNDQAAFAADLGVDASTVYRWIKGQTVPPDDMKIKIAKVLRANRVEQVFPWPDIASKDAA